MTTYSSPGVLNTFFSKFVGDTTPMDPELKELITALRFIQLDRTLVVNDATPKITSTMIENINKIENTDLVGLTSSNTKVTLDKTSGLSSINKKKINGSHKFYYIKYTPPSSSSGTLEKYEYVKLDVDMTDGIYKLEQVNVGTDGKLMSRYNTVHNFLVKEKLSELVDEKVFKLFSTPVKDIDSLSNGTKAFKHLNFKPDDYLYDKSFIDIILDLEKYSQSTSVSLTNDKSDDYKLFNSIYDFMVKSDSVLIPDENSLIMDIVKFQNNIDKSKQSIKEERNKIYTYLSRDKNYTKTLKTKRIMLYLSVVAFVLISILYGGILYNKNMSTPDKSTIVLVIASLILFTNMVLYIMRFTSKSRETFVSAQHGANVFGFTYVDPVPATDINGNANKPTITTISVTDVMNDFSRRYAEILTKEIRNEYYDALYISQEKDKKLLNQLEKEHNIKSSFHQLKNNLTHFKINETKEYSKLSQLAIVLVSLLAILYLAVLQDTIDIQIFKIISGLTFAIFVTYVLLSVKSIMLRDKYDWDRFHWTVKNVKSNMNPQQCPLPGFPN